jgi:hypothetical protein
MSALPNDKPAAPAERQHEVEQRLHRYEGCPGLVRRNFLLGEKQPYHSRIEALQVLASRHERSGRHELSQQPCR